MRARIGAMGTLLAMSALAATVPQSHPPSVAVPTAPHRPPEQRPRTNRQPPTESNPEGRGARRREKRARRKASR